MRICPSCGERGGSVAYPKCLKCKTYTVEEKIDKKGESMAEKNVYQKLAQARLMLRKVEMKKTGFNTFSKYYYFELGDFLHPMIDIFEGLGIISIISFGVDVATLTVTNQEKPEEQIIITSPMSTAKLKACHEVQNLGAVQTYLRRYLYIALMEMLEHDACDASEGPKKEAPAKPAKPAKPTEPPDPRINELGGMVKEMSATSMCAPSAKLETICGLTTFKGISSVTVDEIEPKIHKAYAVFLEANPKPFKVECPEKMMPESMKDCDKCAKRKGCPAHE